MHGLQQTTNFDALQLQQTTYNIQLRERGVKRRVVIRGTLGGREGGFGTDPDKVDVDLVRAAQRERRETVSEVVTVDRVRGERPPVLLHEHAEQDPLLVQREVARRAPART